MSLVQVLGGMEKNLFRSDLRGPEGPFEHFSSDYDSSIANLISRLDIDVIHVQHLAWQSLGIGKIAQAFGVPILYSVHDFYSVCASHTLLDESNAPCFGKCTSGIGSCSAIIWPSSSLRTLKNEDVGLWRANMSSFVSQVKSVIAPSEFTKDLFLRNFPQVADKTSVISHPLPSFKPISPDSWPSARSTIKALVIGDINLGKGALVLESIAKLSGSHGIEFHFLGSTWPGLSAYGVHHGSYSPEQLPTIVQSIKPHVAVVPSIAPETFSLALSELWQLGLPVVATNYGALSERIGISGGGIVAESNNPSLWIEAIKDLALPTNSRVKALESISHWQREAAGTQALPIIAQAYVAEFEKALENL
jgi:glycosyltransferase involved in cell wall biosynthesis